jgi:GNAT superfamily N-acetyltransferase
MTVKIRRAEPFDLTEILALYAQPEMDDGQVLTLQQAEKLFEQFHRYPAYSLYVACDEGRPQEVVGTFALLMMHNLAHLGTPSAIVEDVVVRSDRRRQGIGRQMMHFAMECARQFGCYKLVLSSNQKRGRAHDFYESLGFRRHGYSFHVDP